MHSPTSRGRLGPPASGPVGDDAAAVTQLLRVASGVVLSMATWFAASAAAPALRREWRLDAWEAAALTTAVQAGFVVGALGSAALNLPERIHPPRLAAAGALAAAASTGAVALLDADPTAAILLRAATGASLAMVYPVGLMLVVSWFASRRGFAVGAVVGALAIGSNLPNAVGGVTGDSWRATLLAASALAVVAAGILRTADVGPHAPRASRLRVGAVFVLMRDRGPRLATFGYLGHMWELYAVWAWLPAFAAASLHGGRHPVSGTTVHLLCFLALGAGGAAGCLAGGWSGDRFGHARTAAVAMLTSAACCVAAALTFHGPLVLVAPVYLLWGASVIADSAMFSACLTAAVDRDLVGSALTLQTALGFLLTIATVQTVPVVASGWGWPAAVTLLAAGPLLGAAAMRSATR